MTDPFENDDVRKWLGAYLDGELNNPQCRAWVENHLANCRQCRIELEDLHNLSNLLRADPLPVSLYPVSEFLGLIMDRLSEGTNCLPDFYQSIILLISQIDPNEKSGGSGIEKLSSHNLDKEKE